MRLGFTLLLNFLLVLGLSAQINDSSPFPANFEVTAPASAAGIYDYGTQAADATNPEWGPRLDTDLMGELVWGFNDVDSLGCDEGGMISADVSGKIALIRRGVCGFVNKVFNAQEAGAIGVVIVNHYANDDETGATVFGMLGGDGALSMQVTIPAVFIGRETGEIIVPLLDAGETVEVFFDINKFYNQTAALSYKMPLSEYVPYGMTANYINANPTDSLMVTLTAVVTAPNGDTETVTGSRNVAPSPEGTTANDIVNNSIIQMDAAFVPEELGVHTVVFTNDLDDVVLVDSFEVTEFTYGTDKLAEGETGFGVSTTQERYAEGGKYITGSVVFTDSLGAMATHASFGLENPQDFFDEDDGGEFFTIFLYDADSDDDGEIDLEDSFDDMIPQAVAEYQITGNESPNELLYVAFEEVEELQGNETYYIAVAKDPNSGSGLVPQFTASNDVNYLVINGALATPLEVDDFFGGWGGATNVIRLHLDGFMVPSDVADLPVLAADQVTIAPNPVGNQLNLSLQLEGVANDVKVGIAGVDGRRYGVYQFNQVGDAPLQIDVNNLVTGTYFVSIITDQGYRTVKFVKQ